MTEVPPTERPRTRMGEQLNPRKPRATELANTFLAVYLRVPVGCARTRRESLVNLSRDLKRKERKRRCTVAGSNCTLRYAYIDARNRPVSGGLRSQPPSQAMARVIKCSSTSGWTVPRFRCVRAPPTPCSPDFSAAELARSALPTLVAHAGAIDTVPVDATLRVAGRIRRQRRRGGGGGGGYVHHPADQHRPQYRPRHRNYTALIPYHHTALALFPTVFRFI